MNTFIFVAGYHGQPPLKEVLSSMSERLIERIPWRGDALTKGYAEFPVLNGGWIWMRPEGGGKNPLISEASDERYAVITYGEAAGVPRLQTAGHLLKTWRAGGHVALRGLEARFSAVILDLAERTVLLTGDLLGQRSLRYFSDSGRLIASPHDLPIVATGLCPTDFDWTSAYSIATMGWSLGGKSLLEKVKTCRPWEYLTWRTDGSMERTEDFVIKTPQRIDARDGHAIKKNLEEMVDKARMFAKNVADAEPKIDVTLSSGLDSRAVFALLKSVYDTSKITCLTAGGLESLNVKVASQLSKWYGVKWRQIEHTLQSPSLDNFLRYSDALAFAINGDETIKDLAIKSCTFPNQNKTMVWHGDGGELFRGKAFYKPFESEKHISIAEVKQRLFRWLRFDKVRGLFDQNGILEGLLDRFNHFFEILIDQTNANGWDVLDYFYLYERTGVARARKMRGPNAPYSYYPFYSSNLVELAYRMPAPIANYAQIHRLLIRRYLPKAYWIRINGADLLPFQQKGLVAKSLNKIDRKILGIRRRLFWQSKKNNHDTSYLNNEQLRSASLLGLMGNPVKEILTAKGSISEMLLGRERVNALFDDQPIKWNTRTDLIGNLVTMERWKSMVEEVTRSRLHFE